MLLKRVFLYIFFMMAPILSAQAADSEGEVQAHVDVFGRFLLDHAIADTDQGSARINSTRLRNARVGASVKYGPNLKLKIELNHSHGNGVNLTDGYVEWRAPKDFGAIKLGQFKTPNSLDEEVSLRFASAQERAAFTDAFDLNRRFGIAYLRSNNHYTFSLGIFGDNLEAEEHEESYALAARGTYAPIHNDIITVHLGVSTRYRKQGENTPGIRYNQRPFTRSTTQIIGTDHIAQSDIMIGLEKAFIYDGFWAAGEYATLAADCPFCSNNPNFHGYYIETGYVLGGARSYKNGRFNRFNVNSPVTSGGKGALALFARFDTLDLIDSEIDGGSQSTYVLGADWWLNAHAKLSINYFTSENTLGQYIDGLNHGVTTLTASSTEQIQINGIQIRTQLDF